MPKPPKILDANSGLLTFMLLSDSPDWIDNPREWIDKSAMVEHAESIVAKSTNSQKNEVSELYVKEQPERGALIDRSEELNRALSSLGGKEKADKNLAKKLWAIAYYRHQKLNGKANKASVALKIRELLAKYFPEDLPTGAAVGASQIPSAKTIEKEWLKEPVQKN